MSLFAFDTDMLTLFQEGHPLVCFNVANRPSDVVAVTILSVEEQMSGWYTQVRAATKPESPKPRRSCKKSFRSYGTNRP